MHARMRATQPCGFAQALSVHKSTRALSLVTASEVSVAFYFFAQHLGTIEVHAPNKTDEELDTISNLCAACAIATQGVVTACY